MKQKNYILIQLFLILISLLVGLYFSHKYNLLYAKIALRFIYVFLLLTVLYKNIGLYGLNFFKYLFISIAIDTFISPFFHIPEISFGPVIGTYLKLIPVLFLFLQINKFESNRTEKLIKNQLVILFILFIVFLISNLILVESIISIAIIPVIINLVITSIIFGLTFFLNIHWIPKTLYIVGTFSFLLSKIIASFFYFTSNTPLHLNISVYFKFMSYFLFVLAMYYQNNDEKNEKKLFNLNRESH